VALRVGLVDRGPVDGDALDEAVEVRRGVAAHALPRGAKHRVDHGGDAALAVGPCDVNGGDAGLWIAERSEGGAHGREVEHDAAGDEGREAFDERGHR
jgi:hypothetical protein